MLDSKLQEQVERQKILIEVLENKVARLEKAFFEHRTNVSSAHQL